MEKTGKVRKKYSPKFKLSVILDLVQNNLNYREVIRRHWKTSSKRDEDSYRPTVRKWHRIYLEKGEKGLMTERRGRKSKPHNKPVSTTVDDDLVKENQRLKERVSHLEIYNEYLKKLNALIQSEEEKNNGTKPR